MKKVLFTLAAVAALAACNKDQVIDQKAPEAINFGNVFVEKATRTAYSSSVDIEAFDVYGMIYNGTESSTINIFSQELVSRVMGTNDIPSWTYSVANTQYWIPGNTYYFDAVVDGNVSVGSEVITKVTTDKDGMPFEIELSDASKQLDILYSYHNNEGITYTSGPRTVAFTFNHIMSKAKFTVTNAITTNNGYSYKVKGIKITNAVKSSTYACCNAGWRQPRVGVYTLEFGNAGTSFIKYGESCESDNERLLIPTKKFAQGDDKEEETTINVEFTCELYKDKVVNGSTVPSLVQTKTMTASATTSLKEGNAYNFVIALGNPGEPITFSVENITAWTTPATGVDTGNIAEKVEE